MTNANIEGLGVFYLGRRTEGAAQGEAGLPLLYDSRDLVTHAVVLGMTGSGKTGLCLSLLEEAALDGIPALVIDPKGDLGNLLLTFPNLAPEDFAPWIDPGEVARSGLPLQEVAARTAATWRDGLAASGQDGARISRLREQVELALYTPGSNAGRSVAVLRSLGAPPPEVAQDTEALGERIAAATGGLLGLLGVQADPIRSREHVLISNILRASWTEGRDLDLPGLIAAIQKPPMEKVGVMPLDAFYPAKERFELALALNNLVAAPSFSAWLEGEPLDVARLLYTPEGKPRVAIFHIAHLGDAERMFFVTLLLSATVQWMRAQAGTTSLRALLYMDEVFGYFPPVGNPPCKQAMLTLLKQARAFGLGIVLATQNAVDLDYKGLANAGTWFLGRLQTERDKQRVLEGLEGASAARGGSFDRAALEATLAGLRSRVFLMHNVHDSAPALFETRWCLSYLRGPLTRAEIQALAGPRTETPQPAPPVSAPPQQSSAVPGTSPPDVPVLFATPPAGNERCSFRPALHASARIHHSSAKVGIDRWEDVTLLAPLEGTNSTPGLPGSIWEGARVVWPGELSFLKEAPEGASFAPLPAEATRVKSFTAWSRALVDHLYRTSTVNLWECAKPRSVSRAGETEGEFRSRLALLLREERDAERDRLTARHQPALARLDERIRVATARLQRERGEVSAARVDAAVSVGGAVLGLFLGRRTGTTALRRATRVSREAGQAAEAGESLEALLAQRAALVLRIEADLTALGASVDPRTLVLDPLVIRPKKADISIGPLSLAWVPVS